MTHLYDAIVIGAGHNGLVTAALLARAGLRVLVLEQRDTIGGAAATEEDFPGFKFNTGAHDAGLFRPEIVHTLQLEQHGLTFIESPVLAVALQPAGAPLTLWRDRAQTVVEIARFSKTDAERFPDFADSTARLADVLDGMMTLTPPDLAALRLRELLPWLKVALKVRRLGRREMMDFLRVLPMPVADFLDSWFECDALKGALAAPGVAGSMQGPRASGTALMLLHHLLSANGNGVRASCFIRGGMGQLSAALANAARQAGAEIRTGAEVAHILMQDRQATGVTLTRGEEIASRVVVSNADPRRTLFELVGAPQLPLRVVRRVKNIRFRGSTAKVNLALRSLPRFRDLPDDEAYLSGHILVSPSLDYMERAYDNAKHGEFSREPILDAVIPTVLDPALAPRGQHVMSITVQYAPYHIRDGTWDERRDALGDKVVATLVQFTPNLPDLILHRQVLTPLDWEQEYGLAEGGIYHGQMGLDQLLFMRPVAGWGQYRTPIENLYLCGAGAHPGGGVTGAPGYNTAREILNTL